MDEPAPRIRITMLLLGKSQVGKSALTNTFNGEPLTTDYLETIGADFAIKTIQMDNEYIKIHLWDTSGSERFETIIKSYLRNSDVYVIVLDAREDENILWKDLNKYMDDITVNTAREDPLICIIANTRKGEKVTSTDKLAQRFPGVKHFPLDVSDEKAVERMIESIVREAIQKKEE